MRIARAVFAFLLLLGALSGSLALILLPEKTQAGPNANAKCVSGDYTCDFPKQYNKNGAIVTCMHNKPCADDYVGAQSTVITSQTAAAGGSFVVSGKCIREGVCLGDTVNGEPVKQVSPDEIKNASPGSTIKDSGPTQQVGSQDVGQAPDSKLQGRLGDGLSSPADAGSPSGQSTTNLKGDYGGQSPSTKVSPFDISPYDPGPVAPSPGTGITDLQKSYGGFGSNGLSTWANDLGQISSRFELGGGGVPGLGGPLNSGGLGPSSAAIMGGTSNSFSANSSGALTSPAGTFSNPNQSPGDGSGGGFGQGFSLDAIRNSVSNAFKNLANQTMQVMPGISLDVPANSTDSAQSSGQPSGNPGTTSEDEAQAKAQQAFDTAKQNYIDAHPNCDAVCKQKANEAGNIARQQEWNKSKSTLEQWIDDILKNPQIQDLLNNFSPETKADAGQSSGALAENNTGVMNDAGNTADASGNTGGCGGAISCARSLFSAAEQQLAKIADNLLGINSQNSSEGTSSEAPQKSDFSAAGPSSLTGDSPSVSQGLNPSGDSEKATAARSLHDAAAAFCADQGCDAGKIAEGLGGTANQESSFNPRDVTGSYAGIGQLNSAETRAAADTLARLAESEKLSPAQLEQVTDIAQRVQDALDAGVNPNKDAELGSWLLAARQSDLADMGAGVSAMGVADKFATDPKTAAAVMQLGQLAPSAIKNFDPERSLSGSELSALNRNSVPVHAGDSVADAVESIRNVYGPNFNQGISLVQENAPTTDRSIPSSVVAEASKNFFDTGSGASANAAESSASNGSANYNTVKVTQDTFSNSGVARNIPAQSGAGESFDPQQALPVTNQVQTTNVGRDGSVLPSASAKLPSTGVMAGRLAEMLPPNYPEGIPPSTDVQESLGRLGYSAADAQKIDTELRGMLQSQSKFESQLQTQSQSFSPLTGSEASAPTQPTPNVLTSGYGRESSAPLTDTFSTETGSGPALYELSKPKILTTDYGRTLLGSSANIALSSETPKVLQGNEFSGRVAGCIECTTYYPSTPAFSNPVTLSDPYRFALVESLSPVPPDVLAKTVAPGDVSSPSPEEVRVVGNNSPAVRATDGQNAPTLRDLPPTEALKTRNTLDSIVADAGGQAQVNSVNPNQIPVQTQNPPEVAENQLPEVVVPNTPEPKSPATKPPSAAPSAPPSTNKDKQAPPAKAPPSRVAGNDTSSSGGDSGGGGGGVPTSGSSGGNLSGSISGIGGLLQALGGLFGQSSGSQQSSNSSQQTPVCPSVPAKPDSSACPNGIWNLERSGSNGCATGWRCVQNSSTTTAPTLSSSSTETTTARNVPASQGASNSSAAPQADSGSDQPGIMMNGEAAPRNLFEGISVTSAIIKMANGGLGIGANSGTSPGGDVSSDADGGIASDAAATLQSAVVPLTALSASDSAVTMISFLTNLSKFLSSVASLPPQGQSGTQVSADLGAPGTAPQTPAQLNAADFFQNVARFLQNFAK